MIRPAEISDAAGINAVYNPYILESAATFETEPWSEDARQDWLRARAGDGRCPVFVALDETNRICGFSSASPFDARQAYETSVKASVFIAAPCHGKGLGKKLYQALFDAVAGEDVHRAYGLVTRPNPASAALHKAFGFNHVATLDEVGRKFGRYYSVMWFEKRL